MSFFARSFWSVPTAVYLIVAGGASQAFSQQSNAADPSPSAPPIVTSGSVTLPYSELKTLLDAVRASQQPPASAKAPVPCSVQSARYEMHFDADLRRATGQAVFEVVSFAEGWTTIPLLPTKEIRLARVEPEGALVAVRDGVYTLMMDGPGRRKVTLHFSVDVADDSARRAPILRLTGPSALINELSVTGVPEGWLAEAPGAVSTSAAASENTDKAAPAPVVFRLAADQPLTLKLINAPERKPVPPSVWQAEAQSLVRYDEGQLAYKTCLRFSTDAGTGQSALLSLPRTASVLSITGDDLERWNVVKGESSEARHLEVSWKTPDVLRREIFLKYDLPQTARDGDWRLVSPGLLADGGRLRGALYVLPLIEGIEFLPGDGGDAVVPGDVQQVPRWLAGEIGTGVFSTMAIAKPAPADNASALLHIRRLPLMKTMRATVEESRFRTRLVADGAFLSEGTMNVRHDGPLSFGVILSKGAQLLNCSVNGHDALPIDRGGGKIELNLPVEPEQKSTRVELSCTGRLPALAPVSGQVALSLPGTELFVQTLFWDLQLPDEYELTALEGNVALAPISPAAQNAAPAIHLRKDLLKAELPSAELFYQKRAVNP